MTASGKPGGSGTPPRLIHTLTDDVRVVTEDVMRRGVHRSVSGTLSSLGAFYLTSEERQRLSELDDVRRQLRRVWWFIRGMLMKLTPARRIMLALALLTLVLGNARIDINTFHVGHDTHSLSAFRLLFVFVRGFKDRLISRAKL